MRQFSSHIECLTLFLNINEVVLTLQVHVASEYQSWYEACDFFQTFPIHTEKCLSQTYPGYDRHLGLSFGGIKKIFFGHTSSKSLSTKNMEKIVELHKSISGKG